MAHSATPMHRSINFKLERVCNAAPTATETGCWSILSFRKTISVSARNRLELTKYSCCFNL